MDDYCWDCLYLKTKEYDAISEALKKQFPNFQARLLQGLKNAKERKCRAQYWRCALGKTKAEVYIRVSAARNLKACNSFETMKG